MPDVRIQGADQLRLLSRELRAAGEEGKRLRSRLRRNIAAATRPMKADVQQRARAIPARSAPMTGLREALAKATKIRIATAGRDISVRLQVNHRLAAQVDGQEKWRHPVFGNRNNWVTQPPHPFFTPATRSAFPRTQAAVIAAINETAAEL